MKTDKVCFIDDLTRIKLLMATLFQNNDEFLVKYQINNEQSSLDLYGRFIWKFNAYHNCDKILSLCCKESDMTERLNWTELNTK